MEETFLSRFDVLDARVRKVLQTCAVFGLSFSLSDVVKVHPEMAELDIEIAMEDAVEEMILIEQADDEDDSRSLKSGSTGAGDSGTRSSRSIDGTKGADRIFQFSHAMWRQNVLKTMLKERKIEIHRLIAEAMERDQVSILEQSDISRLLTLFDHWKSCGDFCQTARLSLVVGARLEEWDLCAQSLELYEDALEMSFDTVDPVESELDNAEWMQVAAKPEVLDYILRLHIRVGLCHQNLGEEADSIRMFEDAYNIIKTASCVPGMSKALMMPIISSLCVLKLHKFATDTRSRLEQEKLVEKFVKEAVDNGNLVHIGRALAMEAAYYARLNRFDRAFTSYERLKLLYSVTDNSEEMINEYGRDFAIECCSEAVQWHYLCERHEEAEKQADFIMLNYLPLLKRSEADIAMYAVFPLVQVLKLVGRSRDAEMIVKDYVVRPYQEGSSADFWEPIFNPLAYLLDLIKMEDNEEYDEQLLDEVEAWVLDDMNHEYANAELEPKAHTILGEICWRLVDFKEKDDPSRRVLRKKAKELLSPVANSTQADVFLKNTAQALVEAM
jgi:tetratricopeptide (TPR) repeat protein